MHNSSSVACYISIQTTTVVELTPTLVLVHSTDELCIVTRTVVSYSTAVLIVRTTDSSNTSAHKREVSMPAYDKNKSCTLTPLPYLRGPATLHVSELAAFVPFLFRCARRDRPIPGNAVEADDAAAVVVVTNAPSAAGCTPLHSAAPDKPNPPVVCSPRIPDSRARHRRDLLLCGEEVRHVATVVLSFIFALANNARRGYDRETKYQAVEVHFAEDERDTF